MAYNNKSIIKDVNQKPVPQYFNKETDKYEVITSENGMLRVVPVDIQGEAIPFKSLVDQIDNKLGELIEVAPSGDIYNRYINNTNELSKILNGELEGINENLVPNSNYFHFVNYQGNTHTKEVLSTGYTRFITTGGTSILKMLYMIMDQFRTEYNNQKLTISFDLKNNAGIPMRILHNWDKNLGSDIIPDKFEGRYSFTGTVNGSVVGQVQFRTLEVDENINIELRNTKVEVGGISTPWISNPEDVIK